MATDANGVILGPVPAGTPHFQVPFTVSPAGPVATVEQGSTEEITQSVAMLAGTLPGTRYLVPAYGTPDPTFSGLDPAAFRLSVAKWEPRATVSVTSTPDGSTDDITIVVATAVAP